MVFLESVGAPPTVNMVLQILSMTPLNFTRIVHGLCVVSDGNPLSGFLTVVLQILHILSHCGLKFVGP